MDKTQAKLTLYQEIDRQAESFLCFVPLENKEIPAFLLNNDEWSVSFPVTKLLKEIHVTVEFHERWLDVLLSPRPCVITEGNTLQMIRFVNHLNGNAILRVTNGKFYVDENAMNVMYSARITYDHLEQLPREAVFYGLMQSLSFMSDAVTSLYQVGHGEMSAEDGAQYIKNMWLDLHEHLTPDDAAHFSIARLDKLLSSAILIEVHPSVGTFYPGLLQVFTENGDAHVVYYPELGINNWWELNQIHPFFARKDTYGPYLAEENGWTFIKRESLLVRDDFMESFRPVYAAASKELGNGRRIDDIHGLVWRALGH